MVYECIPLSLSNPGMLLSIPKDPLLLCQPLLSLHPLRQPGRARDEEFRQQHPGEAANEHPVGVEPGQGDRGEEGDPDKDDEGQVKVTVVLISLGHGVGHHSEEYWIDYDDVLSDILENINGDNADEVGDEYEEEKLLSSFFLVDVQISNLRFSSHQCFFIVVASQTFRMA